MNRFDNTLTNRFNLIQRCLERDKTFADAKKGVDKIISFDYMGSAEFEFGTLPHTFNLMRELAVAGKLVLFKTPTIVTYQNKPFWVLMPSAWSVTEMEDKLRELIEGKVRCKESHYIEYWMPNVKKVEFRFEREDKWRNDMRDRTTAWLACVERRYDEQVQPAFWCVHEGTARKMLEELRTPRIVESKSPSASA